MDATILTTFFCFILLVLNIVLFMQFRDLTIHVNAHMDRSDLHSEKLKTILSVLQQLEAQQHLMFSNSPPVPGETLPSLPVVTKDTDWSEGYWVNAPGEPQPDLDNADRGIKVSGTVPTDKSPDVLAKKRGRPRKTPLTKID